MDNRLNRAERTATKAAYAPPRVEFVPLKLEERLLSCNKVGIRTQCFGASNQLTS